MEDGQNLCSSISLQAEEPLAGSASETRVWFLLEHGGPWGKRAFEDSDLPEAVKDWLNQALAQVERGRLLLIRRPQGAAISQAESDVGVGRAIEFFVALASESSPVLYRFNVPSYNDLIQIDLPGLVHGTADYAAFRSPERLFLVCTNGRRDACCTRYGVGVYAALAGRAEQNGAAQTVWQCTHVGGHRFAANVICLPHGLYYGRVSPEDAPVLYSAYHADQFWPEKARGRAYYPEPVQAAELYLRAQTAELSLEAFELLEAVQKGGDWHVRFKSRAGDGETALRVVVEDTGIPVRKGCLSEKTVSMIRYQVNLL